MEYAFFDSDSIDADAVVALQVPYPPSAKRVTNKFRVVTGNSVMLEPKVGVFSASDDESSPLQREMRHLAITSQNLEIRFVPVFARDGHDYVSNFCCPVLF